MKLQQLKYIYEVARHDLNVSATAESLYTSQPGISKQIRLLEDELGVQIFTRSGKHLTNITPAGVQILEVAAEILRLSKKIQDISADFVCEDKGTLRVATTHTFSRYLLPNIIENFRQKYPSVRLHLHQGIGNNTDQMLDNGDIDLVIYGENERWFTDKVQIPCFLWHLCLVVQRGHPITREPELTLEKLAEYPLLGKLPPNTKTGRVHRAFSEQGISPNYVITATDSEILKSYVRMGLGVGIIARMAFSPEQDKDLQVVNADHLFRATPATMVFHKNFYVRQYVADFVNMLAPHMSKELIQQASRCRSENELESLLNGVSLPER